MDEETLTRYAAAFQMPPETIRAWYDSLPPEQRAVIVKCWKRRAPPGPRDGDGWAADYRHYEAASASFTALAVQYLQETLP